MVHLSIQLFSSFVLMNWGSGIYFSAYPNPVSIELNIKIESNLIGSQFKIINALGQEVKQGELSNLNATIDVSRATKRKLYYAYWF